MPKRSKTESAKSKVESAVALGGLGASIGGPIGAGVGALTGLIIGDNETVFPLDMVAIPAFQMNLLSDQPAFMIYIRAGETLLPTGGNVADMEQGAPASMQTEFTRTQVNPVQKKKMSAYQRRYKKAFKRIAPTYKTKGGKWKKDGFKKAVRQAHQEAKK